MHKLTLTLVAGAVGALAVSATTRSEAGALAGAEGLLPAIDDVSPVLNVHWRRYGYGWRRHRLCRLARLWLASALLRRLGAVMAGAGLTTPAGVAAGDGAGQFMEPSGVRRRSG